ncbi:hypothetical protein M413DRAFT_282270 [Hebeloma cylindrosporum]|uniref:Uncharacterized protein n=1 Tax=Hebeloma cylindrosporum TaxID=76867 RepID=A0A0C3BXY1_HEBCY|nr:hypothetical protein M413DRAFT_282270 [Hebeloma cylindrosporum h7]
MARSPVKASIFLSVLRKYLVAEVVDPRGTIFLLACERRGAVIPDNRHRKPRSPALGSSSPTALSSTMESLDPVFSGQKRTTGLPVCKARENITPVARYYAPCSLTPPPASSAPPSSSSPPRSSCSPVHPLLHLHSRHLLLPRSPRFFFFTSSPFSPVPSTRRWRIPSLI